MVAPARVAAMQVLQKVSQGRNADDVLHGEALAGLDARDSALATALVMAVLRWQRVLDAAIVPKLRSAAETPAAALMALRLGLAQLWFLDRIPAHAALSESVELVRSFGAPQSAGMVNAVLRRLQQREQRASSAAVEAQEPWMLARWRGNYGEEAALRVAEASQREPQQMVRGPGEGGVYLTRASLRDGAAMSRVQDEGSQLVAEIAAAAAPDARQVLDACAAPGGKTQVLAELLPAAEITAVDASAARLRVMERLLAPEFAARIRLRHADASVAAAENPDVDLALCDVPCSGTGTLARNPEIRLRLREEQLAVQAARQEKILDGVLDGVRPGGVAVYSTCSMEPEENEHVVRAVLAKRRDVSVVPVAEVLAAMEASGALRAGALAELDSQAVRGEFLQTLPGVCACDGFFAAVLRKL